MTFSIVSCTLFISEFNSDGKLAKPTAENKELKMVFTLHLQMVVRNSNCIDEVNRSTTTKKTNSKNLVYKKKNNFNQTSITRRSPTRITECNKKKSFCERKIISAK